MVFGQSQYVSFRTFVAWLKTRSAIMMPFARTKRTTTRAPVKAATSEMVSFVRITMSVKTEIIIAMSMLYVATHLVHTAVYVNLATLEMELTAKRTMSVLLAYITVH